MSPTIQAPAPLPTPRLTEAAPLHTGISYAITSRKWAAPLPGSQAISFEGNFDSEPGAQFVAEIVADGSANFSNLQAVHDNPVPPGAAVVALTMTNFDDYGATSRTYNTANNSKLDKAATRMRKCYLPQPGHMRGKGAITSIR